jgi:hypothetical protein
MSITECTENPADFGWFNSNEIGISHIVANPSHPAVLRLLEEDWHG